MWCEVCTFIIAQILMHKSNTLTNQLIIHTSHSLYVCGNVQQLVNWQWGKLNKWLCFPYISFKPSYVHPPISSTYPPMPGLKKTACSWQAPRVPQHAQTLFQHTPVEDNPWSLTYIMCPLASDLTMYHSMARLPYWDGSKGHKEGKEQAIVQGQRVLYTSLTM